MSLSFESMFKRYQGTINSSDLKHHMQIYQPHYTTIIDITISLWAEKIIYCLRLGDTMVYNVRQCKIVFKSVILSPVNIEVLISLQSLALWTHWVQCYKLAALLMDILEFCFNTMTYLHCISCIQVVTFDLRHLSQPSVKDSLSSCNFEVQTTKK